MLHLYPHPVTINKAIGNYKLCVLGAMEQRNIGINKLRLLTGNVVRYGQVPALHGLRPGDPAQKAQTRIIESLRPAAWDSVGQDNLTS